MLLLTIVKAQENSINNDNKYYFREIILLLCKEIN